MQLVIKPFTLVLLAGRPLEASVASHLVVDECARVLASISPLVVACLLLAQVIRSFKQAAIAVPNSRHSILGCSSDIQLELTLLQYLSRHAFFNRKTLCVGFEL